MLHQRNAVKNPIYINDYALLTPVNGTGFNCVNHSFTNLKKDFIAALPASINTQIQQLKKENSTYKKLDRTVLMAILTARKFKNIPQFTGINIGSSRGATGVWESGHVRFCESGTTTPNTSPLSTLGNVSSWVAQDLKTTGVAFSHSITCATASHAILNAIAWLQSDMASSFIAGGVEAPLTPFTIAQMQSLRIYASNANAYPCKALDLDKTSNTMILGEAAGLFLLSKDKTAKVHAAITGYGTAIEQLRSATSVSTDGDCLRDAMRACLKGHDLETIDAIITHAPGTILGDKAEFAAIQTVFGPKHPVLCNNKWQVGHSLGASAAVNIAMAIEMFHTGIYFQIPYLEQAISNPRGTNTAPKKILVNATGFGGNAVSLLLETT